MRPDRLYLLDMLAAADAIDRFLVPIDKERLTPDDLVQAAVLQKLTGLGEAAARLSDGLKDAYSTVECALPSARGI